VQPLGLRERFQVITSGAFVVLGLAVLVRGMLAGVWPAVVFGAALLALGILRVRLIVQALREARR